MPAVRPPAAAPIVRPPAPAAPCEPVPPDANESEDQTTFSSAVFTKLAFTAITVVAAAHLGEMPG